MADILTTVIGTKRPDGIADDDLDLPTDDASLDLAARGPRPIRGRRRCRCPRLTSDWNTSTASSTMRSGGWPHRSSRRSWRTAGAANDRAARGLEMLDRAALRDARDEPELATSR